MNGSLECATLGMSYIILILYSLLLPTAHRLWIEGASNFLFCHCRQYCNILIKFEMSDMLALFIGVCLLRVDLLFCRCDSLVKLKSKLDSLRGYLKDSSNFKKIYRYAFDFYRVRGLILAYVLFMHTHCYVDKSSFVS